MIRLVIALVALAGTPALANDLAPTGTLSATYIATNPVQASVDPRPRRCAGRPPTRARTRRAHGIPLTIKGANGVQGVIDSVKNGEADIGFVASTRRAPRRSIFAGLFAGAEHLSGGGELADPVVADADKAGCAHRRRRARSGDHFLTRTLKHAELRRNEGGDLEVALRQLAAGEIDAYAGNRSACMAPYR